MELQLGEIIGTREALRDLKRLPDSFPIRLSVKLARNLRQLDREIEAFEKANREAVKRHGKKVGDDSYMIDQEDEEAVRLYMAEVKDALEETVVLPINQITVAELEDSGVRLPVGILSDLHYLFDLNEPENE